MASYIIAHPALVWARARESRRINGLAVLRRPQFSGVRP